MLIMGDRSRSSSGSDSVYFRNGFVLAPEGHPVVVREGWAKAILGGLQMITHPETPVKTAALGQIHLALIGHAFDPEREIYAEEDVLAALLGDVENEALLHETLDRLAGRFALIVISGGRIEIFQDAMGSRSVFYAVSGPTIAASHAELVREATGANFADFFVPFITSKGYQQRDVKYLPGVASPFEGIVQLTPNTKLVLNEQRSERFWPREAIGSPLRNEDAASVLVNHMEGLSAYLAHHDFRPFVGLTAGTDSRGVFAAVRNLDPYLFTYVRSEKGTAVNSKDARVAAELAERYGLSVNVWPILNKLTLNGADDLFSHAFRLATGYYRGSGSPWLPELAKARDASPNGLFVRGFGGEVMRGFYQVMSNSIQEPSVREMSRTYDVNSGSNVTRRLFAEMIERTQFTHERLHGYDPNDIFYWEHRMGTWGSVAMAEADLAMPSVVGYNSRNLYMAFMRLSGPDRLSRVAFEMATDALAPKLAAAS